MSLPASITAETSFTVGTDAVLQGPSQAQIVWSEDGLKAALLINRYPHAVFDFAGRRGYRRSGFPAPDPNWTKFDHAWDDSAQEFFR